YHDEPVSFGACDVIRHLQHDPYDELDHQRLAGAISEAESDLDRERAGLGAVHDAAAGSRIPDAAIGRAAAEAAAERIHRGDVFYVAAAGGDHSAHAGGDVQGRARGYAADVFVGLAALGFRRAGADCRAAVFERAGEAQHSGRNGAETLQALAR